MSTWTSRDAARLKTLRSQVSWTRAERKEKRVLEDRLRRHARLVNLDPAKWDRYEDLMSRPISLVTDADRDEAEDLDYQVAPDDGTFSAADTRMLDSLLRRRDKLSVGRTWDLWRLMRKRRNQLWNDEPVVGSGQVVPLPSLESRRGRPSGISPRRMTILLKALRSYEGSKPPSVDKVLNQSPVVLNARSVRQLLNRKGIRWRALVRIAWRPRIVYGLRWLPRDHLPRED